MLHRACDSQAPRRCGTLLTKETPVIALGLILLIIGLVASVNILFTLGIILLLVGVVLNFVPMGGNRRRVW